MVETQNLYIKETKKHSIPQVGRNPRRRANAEHTAMKKHLMMNLEAMFDVVVPIEVDRCEKEESSYRYFFLVKAEDSNQGMIIGDYKYCHHNHCIYPDFVFCGLHPTCIESLFCSRFSGEALNIKNNSIPHGEPLSLRAKKVFKAIEKICLKNNVSTLISICPSREDNVFFTSEIKLKQLNRTKNFPL